jgi:hypothetical protein
MIVKCLYATKWEARLGTNLEVNPVKCLYSSTKTGHRSLVSTSVGVIVTVLECKVCQMSGL